MVSGFLLCVSRFVSNSSAEASAASSFFASAAGAVVEERALDTVFVPRLSGAGALSGCHWAEEPVEGCAELTAVAASGVAHEAKNKMRMSSAVIIDSAIKGRELVGLKIDTEIPPEVVTWAA